MLKKELKQAIKKVKYVFGCVRLYNESIAYLEIKKGSLLQSIKNDPKNTEYSAIIRENEKESLYIN